MWPDMLIVTKSIIKCALQMKLIFVISPVMFQGIVNSISPQIKLLLNPLTVTYKINMCMLEKNSYM